MDSGQWDDTEVVVEYLTSTGPGVLRRRSGSGGRRIADLVVADEADPRVVLSQLIDDVELAGRLSKAAHRLSSTSTEALELLEDLAVETPLGVGAPAAGLTREEESVLREAGSLAVDVPSIGRRASTTAAKLERHLMVGAVPVRDAAKLLGVSESRIRQRLAERSLLGIQQGTTWTLPKFQFPDDVELRGLAEVLRAFPIDSHPLSIALFLERQQPDLEIDGSTVSPSFWLTTGGDIPSVVELAASAYEYP